MTDEEAQTFATIAVKYSDCGGEHVCDALNDANLGFVFSLFTSHNGHGRYVVAIPIDATVEERLALVKAQWLIDRETKWDDDDGNTFEGDVAVLASADGVPLTEWLGSF